MKVVSFPRPFPRHQDFPGVYFHYDMDFGAERKSLSLLVENYS